MYCYINKLLIKLKDCVTTSAIILFFTSEPTEEPTADPTVLEEEPTSEPTLEPTKEETGNLFLGICDQILITF